MTRIAGDDLFLGTWRLQPELSKYELGQPPQEGLYRITRDGESYIFDTTWKTAEGQQLETSFSGTPDGQRVAYEDPEIADALSLTRVDELTLDSETFKGGWRIALARRELINGGMSMRVTQSGQVPDVAAFSNISYYHKLD